LANTRHLIAGWLSPLLALPSLVMNSNQFLQHRRFAMFEDVSKRDGEEVLAPNHHYNILKSFLWDEEASDNDEA
jgi:hypothetical protein